MEQVGRDVPSKRSGHAAAVVGNHAFIFGGIDGRNPPGPNAELWCSELQAGRTDVTWARMEPAGGSPVPPARWRHTLTALSPAKLLLFGGFHSASKRLGDSWVFDVPSRTWTPYVHVEVEALSLEDPDSALGGKLPSSGAGDVTGDSESGGDAPLTTTTTTRLTRDSSVDDLPKVNVSSPSSSSSGDPAGDATESPTVTQSGGAGVDGVVAAAPPAAPATEDVTVASQAPAPRGAHSAVLIGDIVYVFGGHGGEAGDGNADDGGAWAPRRHLYLVDWYTYARMLSYWLLRPLIHVLPCRAPPPLHPHQALGTSAASWATCSAGACPSGCGWRLPRAAPTAGPPPGPATWPPH